MSDAAELAASGPRGAGREDAFRELIGDIAAGAQLHYASAGTDPDLDLLLGDQRYARGLAKLAELGDLDAIAELADLISLVAQTQAAGDPELAAAVWEAGAVAVGWGTSDRYEAAKQLARDGAPGAAAALLVAAQARREPGNPGDGACRPH
jgi:hypothetical protein